MVNTKFIEIMGKGPTQAANREPDSVLDLQGG